MKLIIAWIKRSVFGDRGWEAEISAGRLRMRKRFPDGKSIYREPTAGETRAYLDDEAW